MQRIDAGPIPGQGLADDPNRDGHLERGVLAMPELAQPVLADEADQPVPTILSDDGLVVPVQDPLSAHTPTLVFSQA